jgi:hypothetical protein
LWSFDSEPNIGVIKLRGIMWVEYVVLVDREDKCIYSLYKVCNANVGEDKCIICVCECDRVCVFVFVFMCVCVCVCVCVTSKAFGEETTQGACKALLANNATKHVFSHCLWRPYYVSTFFVFKCIHRLFSESVKIFGTLESKKSLRFES